MPIHKCDACRYVTHRKSSFESHLQSRRHARGGLTVEEHAKRMMEEQVPTYECERCDYQTRSQISWDRHIRSQEHKERVEETIHVCPHPWCTKWSSFPEVLEGHKQRCERDTVVMTDDLPILPNLLPLNLRLGRQLSLEEFAREKGLALAAFQRQRVKHWIPTLIPRIEPTKTAPDISRTYTVLQVNNLIVMSPTETQVDEAGKVTTTFPIDRAVEVINEYILKRELKTYHLSPGKIRNALGVLNGQTFPCKPVPVQKHVCVYKAPLARNFVKAEATRAYHGLMSAPDGELELDI